MRRVLWSTRAAEFSPKKQTQFLQRTHYSTSKTTSTCVIHKVSMNLNSSWHFCTERWCTVSWNLTSLFHNKDHISDRLIDRQILTAEIVFHRSSTTPFIGLGCKIPSGTGLALACIEGYTAASPSQSHPEIYCHVFWWCKTKGWQQCTLYIHSVIA